VINSLKYYKIYKPYGVLSQFTDESGRTTLKNLYKFPPDVYPVGRLDYDSEGLLLITNDKALNAFLLHPSSKAEKEYLVQVEGKPAAEDIDRLKEGVVLEGKKTSPAKAEIIEEPDLPPRIPPIRVRKSIPESWIRLTITEGRNRQVRKMTAKIGYPALRLVRVRINNITLKGMQPGEVREMTSEELKLLHKLL
jgi:23S rRNA pseudouridine2457 synthase